MNCWCEMELGRSIDVDRDDTALRESAISTLVEEAQAVLPRGTVFEIRGKVCTDPKQFGVAWYTNKRLQENAFLRIDGKLVNCADTVQRVSADRAPMHGLGGFLLIARLQA